MRDFIGDKISSDPHYILIRHQLEQMQRMNQQINFGSKISILLVTIQSEASMIGLKEYLENSTDITVYQASDLYNARKIIRSRPLDFMIIVGSFQYKRDYRIVEKFEYFNKYSFVILYTGMKDSDLTVECAKYNIFHTYSRHDRLDGLISAMQALHVISTERVEELISKSALKEQMLNQLLPNLSDYREVAPDDESKEAMKRRNNREKTKRGRLRSGIVNIQDCDSPEIVKARLNETMNAGMAGLVRQLSWFHSIDSIGLMSDS